MAPLPKPSNTTVNAIYKAVAEARRNAYEGIGISVSSLGNECERALWYAFRWAAPQEEIDGKKALTFHSGDIIEWRLLDYLRQIDCTVVDVDDNGRQFRVEAVYGHVRGKGDGQILGLPEAPKTWHAVECKSMGDKYFKAVVKAQSVKEGYYTHYVQTIVTAYLYGLDRALYIAQNKNTDELYCERLHIDKEEVERILARAERIIKMPSPPAKLHEDPKAKMAFACGWCRFKDVCHHDNFARVHCRTCLYATPETIGGAAWSCSRWVKPLSLDEQRAGCGQHLYIPALVPGEQVDVNEEEEWVLYRLRNGSDWKDQGKPLETLPEQASDEDPEDAQVEA